MNDIQGKKILLIDDEPEQASLVKLVFSLEAAEVFTASDGRQGLHQFRTYRPDLVLLDVMLPDMDGYQVCQQIRQASDVPVIIVSGSDRVRDVNRCLECGADDFISKPYSIDVLLARVGAVLHRAALVL
jgi:DNA-binding response OmpR family regulator